jgi:hypothetical protein
MKGIPALGLKRLKRAATVTGVAALVVGGSLLASTNAYALSVIGQPTGGSQTSTLTLTPASGAVGATGITYSASACPSGNQAAAAVYAIDPTTPAGAAFGTINKDQVANQNASVASAFSGTFTTTFTNEEGNGVNIAAGTTFELAVYCFAAANGSTAGVWAWDTFVTISPDNTTYTTSATPPAGPASTSVGLTATNPAYAGQNITITATVTGTPATNGTPAGSVAFLVGGTGITGCGSQPITNGVATCTTNTFPVGTAALTAVYSSSDTTKWVTGSIGSLSLTVQTAPTFSGTIPLAVTVPSSGAFSLTVDSTHVVTLTTTTAAPLVATGSTTPIVVSDTRNTFPGWSVSGQDSQWTGTGTAAGGIISGNQLGWVPTQTALAPAVTLGGTVAPGAPGLGTTAAVLASVHAGSGNGYGTSTLGADLTLNIPATAPAGPYTSGLTITAVNAN